ncbi:hypothetical protein [Bacillus solitudinis]|nr:hypothetical protein [Bacillus solitudinis]
MERHKNSIEINDLEKAKKANVTHAREDKPLTDTWERALEKDIYEEQ